MALDADPEVVGVAAQPMWLRWTGESGRLVRHAPDYFARRADGTAVVVDVRPDQRIGEKDAAVFAATGGCAPRSAGGMRPERRRRQPSTRRARSPAATARRRPPPVPRSAPARLHSCAAPFTGCLPPAARAG